MPAEVLSVGGEQADGQFLVVFEDVLTLENGLGQLAEQHDVVPSHEYNINGEFLGFAAELDDAALDTAAGLDGVRYIEPSFQMSVLGGDDVIWARCENFHPDVPWNMARVNGNMTTLRNYNYHRHAARNSPIYILDTGVQCHNHGYSWGKCENVYCAPGIEDCNRDFHGHGTHMAGVIGSTGYGLAKGSYVYSAKVFDETGWGSTANILGGLDWAARQNDGAHGVASLGFGGAFSQATNEAVDAAYHSGLLVVTAAGNNATDACSFSPASASTALTVGGTDVQNRVSEFSNQGSCVDLFAPGTDILSLWVDRAETSVQSGTSMAAAHVVATAVLLRNVNKDAPLEDIVEALLDNAYVDGLTGVDHDSPNLFVDTCTINWDTGTP